MLASCPARISNHFRRPVEIPFVSQLYWITL